MTKTKTRRQKQTPKTASRQRTSTERTRKTKRSGGSTARSASTSTAKPLSAKKNAQDDVSPKKSKDEITKPGVVGPQPTDDEPSAADIAAEEIILDEAGGLIGEKPRSAKGRARAKARERNVPAAGKDLLASYMDQLSRIPLFTPQQELDNARHLEDLELSTWNLVLLRPRAVEHTLGESG
ncbi:MAG: hypothetical protein AAFX94_21565, partial [Myxococcota bacterium]